jgi:3-isopropylmalate dehydrogenase
MSSHIIAVLPGDGIGPDVTEEALKSLRAVERRTGSFKLEFKEYPAGAGEYLKSGDPLPASTMEGCRAADAILLGAMGLPGVRWASGTEMTPQIDLREQLDLYAGVRPIRLYHAKHSPLHGYAAGEIDLVIFRESTEGLFASRKNSVDFAAPEVRDTLLVTRHAAARICRSAFEMALKRRSMVTLVDKANVLPSMAYFRSVFQSVAGKFPSVKTECVYVDAAALFLVKNPRRFDVMVMENMFGDILSDLAAGLVGGMGMAPSGDIGDEYAVFQPSHGSAPDIAGKGIANPIATIVSAAMMLEWLGEIEAAAMIQGAVDRVCSDASHATPDIGGSMTTGEIGDLVVREIEK